MATGTLAREKYLKYLATDAAFLFAFNRAYAMALVKAADVKQQAVFHALIGGVLDELKLHEGACAKWGVDPSEVDIHPAATAYIDFLERLHPATLDELVAGMVPCMRLYAALGRKFVGESLVSPDSPYAEWFEAYGGDEMEGLAAQLETLLPEAVTDAVDAGRGRVFGYVIKGNPSEIEALLRLTVDSSEMKTKTTTTTTRVSVGASVSCTAESSVVDGHGVGTGEKKVGHIFDALQRLCEVTGCLAVVMTGKTDYVYTFRGERWSSDENSCEALEKWTGAGCALGVVVAAFIAANGDDLFSALQAACQWYRRVARRCADEFSELGPFSFQARFFDELYRESCAYGSQV